MSRNRRLLCSLYGLIAVVALIATGTQNAAFIAEHGLSYATGFVAFWPALLVNHATISITVDLFLFGLAAGLWMVFEARRLGIRFAWLYVFFGIVVAISVTFPLFLLARERRLLGLSAAVHAEVAPGGLDYLGLGVLTLGTLAFALYCTLL